MTALASAPWQAAHTAAKLAAPLTRSGFATWAGAAAAGVAAAPFAGAAASPAANDDTAGTTSKAASREIANSFISGVLIGLAHKTYNLLILQWLAGRPDRSGLAALLATSHGPLVNTLSPSSAARHSLQRPPNHDLSHFLTLITRFQPASSCAIGRSRSQTRHWLATHGKTPDHRPRTKTPAPAGGARNRFRGPFQCGQVHLHQHPDAATPAGLCLENAGPHAKHQ